MIDTFYIYKYSQIGIVHDFRFFSLLKTIGNLVTKRESLINFPNWNEEGSAN